MDDLIKQMDLRQVYHTRDLCERFRLVTQQEWVPAAAEAVLVALGIGVVEPVVAEIVVAEIVVAEIVVAPTDSYQLPLDYPQQ